MLSSHRSAGLGDVSAHPICISDVSSNSGDPDQVLSDDDLPPEVHVVDLPPEVLVDLVSPVSPPVSARMSPCLPPEASLVQSADSSVAISPNRVRSDNTPDISPMDAGPVFEVSPDTSGFLMRPSGAAVQALLPEFIGAPESARLLYRSPTFWIQRMGEEDAVAAAVNLQRDAGVMLSNLQILSQFVTSLQWMSTEMLDLALGHVVFPSQEVVALSPAPWATRAAQYMAAMGSWRPQMDPGDPGPVPASSCNACMNCQYCFPEGPDPSGN